MIGNADFSDDRSRPIDRFREGDLVEEISSGRRFKVTEVLIGESPQGSKIESVACVPLLPDKPGGIRATIYFPPNEIKRVTI